MCDCFKSLHQGIRDTSKGTENHLSQLSLVQVFASRGYFARLLLASSDLNKIDDLDAALTQCVTDMQTSLQVSTIKLTRESFDGLRRSNEDIKARLESLGGLEVSDGSAALPTTVTSQVLSLLTTPHVRHTMISCCGVLLHLPVIHCNRELRGIRRRSRRWQGLCQR